VPSAPTCVEDLVATADDGARLRLRTRGGSLRNLDHVLPPVGLIWGRESGLPVHADREIEVQRQDGNLEIRVDGRPRRGGRDALESELALFAAEHLVDEVAVHAALVATEAGVIMLPGRSFSGKSTLAVTLGELGAKVLSDEFALVRPDGTVRGWRRAARLRRPGGGRDRVPVDDDVMDGHWRVALVASLRFDDAMGWNVSPVTPAQGVLHILDNTVPAQRYPDRSLTAAMAVAKTARCLSGTRGEAGDAAERFHALLCEQV
jgi:hypothetical protein